MITCQQHRGVTKGSVQALEKSVEAGGALDQYEIEGPDRAELLQDLAEFQLAAVGALLHFHCPAALSCCLIFSGGWGAASPGKLPSPLAFWPIFQLFQQQMFLNV